MGDTDDSLREGIYEDLITPRIEAQLAVVAAQLQADSSGLDNAEAADRLALHLAALVERAVSALPEGSRATAGTEIVRKVGLHLAGLSKVHDLDVDLVAERPQVLRAVRRLNPDGTARSVTRPLTPLLDTTLLINARGEPALGKQLLSEIESADGIDAIIAFIRYSGIRPMLDALRAHCAEGKPLRILTTTYTGSTEARALEELRGIGADVRVSYDTSSTRLHAKAWLFRRAMANSTAYIGSSNLTHSAQIVGLEWNVRASAKRNPAVVSKVGAVFDSYWEGGDFIAYDPAVFASEITRDRTAATTELPPFELRPEPFQQRLLEQVDLSRALGHHRNLLVAATGTGKTVMAALDYARLQQTLPRSRLLFVAHREEILKQSLATFRYALREHAFGQLWVGGAHPDSFDHVFASIQSLNAAGVDRIDPEHFDVVIVDEFHHAAADSYDRLLKRLLPKELLGLTATPERADGMPILQWFDDRIAAELRLWDAIDQQRLAPFAYYGISDGSDLSAVPWRRGTGYDVTALTNVYTSNDVWARTVIHQTQAHVADARSMRALGFCVSIEHAAFMAHHFARAGIESRAITSGTNGEQRAQALRDLRDGRIQAIFSVDLFNEGVDIPSVDTILMLRPTQSATVFLQQLGRGLRKSTSTRKTICTVLDFVGNQRKEFRFDAKYSALLGGSRKDLVETITNDFPYLPSGCSMELDPVARETVLRSIREALPSTWPARVLELRAIVAAGHVPTLANYLAHSGLDVSDVYANGRSWSDMREAAGLVVPLPGPHESTLRRAVGRMLHVDDSVRLGAYEQFATSTRAPIAAKLDQHDRALLRMLVVTLVGSVLSQSPHKDADLQAATDLLWQHPAVLAEVGELVGVLADRIDHLCVPLADRPTVPLQVHAQYTRQEILAAMHCGDDTAATPTWREGVRWLPDMRTDVFAFTLVKTAGHFSPTTRYRDYAISPSLIHWESQSTTRAGSTTGLRYRNHEQQGSQVYLFARVTSDSKAFWFLGPATFVKHQGELPMAITWRLRIPLPGDLFAEFAAAV